MLRKNKLDKVLTPSIIDSEVNKMKKTYSKGQTTMNKQKTWFDVVVKGTVGRQMVWAKFITELDAVRFADELRRIHPTWTVTIKDKQR